MAVDCYAQNAASPHPIFKMSTWGWVPIVLYLKREYLLPDAKEWFEAARHEVTAEEAFKVGTFIESRIETIEDWDLNDGDVVYRQRREYFALFADFCNHSGGFQIA